MKSDTENKLKIIENGLKYLVELDLLDTFYDKIWSKDTPRLMEKYIDNKSFYDIPREEDDDVKKHVVEWFGEDYGLAIICDEFWMVSVGSVDEGGNKWWYKIKINTDKKEIARKVILFDKCLPGKYCNLYLR
jgi:hypothetical protein